MILTIRPKKDSKDLIKDLEQTNYKVHFEQFSRYIIKDFYLDFNAKHFFLISSKQTIRSLKRKITFINNLAKRGKLFVVGKKIEKELKELNFKLIIKTFMDSKELINHIKKKYKSKIYINHLTGSVENKRLKIFSRTTGVRLNFIETYKVIFKKSISDKLKLLFKQKKIRFMIHYSLKASQIFYDTLTYEEKFYFRNRISHFCLSNRIKKGLLTVNVRSDRLSVAKKADHESLMLLLNNSLK